jgi:hypothetical protein
MKRQLVSAQAAVSAAKVTVFGKDQGSNGAHALSVNEAEAALAELKAKSKTIAVKAPLGEVRPTAMRFDDERKRLHDAVRMATCNAESTLAAVLGAHCARAEEGAHSVLAEAFSASPFASRQILREGRIIASSVHVRPTRVTSCESPELRRKLSSPRSAWK